MAVEIGTATDSADLYAKLISFLTTNADLVAAGQEWGVAWEADPTGGYPSDIVLVGPGLGGTDEIYVGMRLYGDAVQDRFWVELRGMTGVVPSGEDYTSHVNVQPQPSLMFLDGSVMDYWFIANGRRFICVVKITTVFEACYAGFFLPYGTPTEYPYPMFVGGSAGEATVRAESPKSWRDDVVGHSHFLWARMLSPTSNSYYESCAHVLGPSGSWMKVANGSSDATANIGPSRPGLNHLENTADSSYFLPPSLTLERLMDCYGGDKMLIPIPLFEKTPGNQTFGVLQGAYKSQGVASGAEDIVTISGASHMLVQNAYRTGFDDYWAVELT